MVILAQLVFLILTFGLTTGHQNHAKIPIYSTNIKGWVEIWPLDDNPTTDGVNVNFKLDFVGKMPNTLEFWSTNTPLVYGSDPCPDFRSNAEIFAQKFANFSTTKNDNNNNKIEENAIIKNVTLVVAGDGRTAACANILTQESKIFQAKFYGPNVGGNIFAYLNENLKLLKISARILNANNFETNLRWSMKKFWWLPKQDDREPGVISCREKSRNAFVWYEPDANNSWSYVTPERAQLIEISNFDLTSDNLAKAVFVLEKSSEKQWESNKATGCARVYPTWDAGLNSQVCSPKGELLSLSQETLFDPILVRKLNKNCEHKIKNESADLENFDDLLKIGDDLGVKPGASISQFVDHVTVNESTKAIAHYFYPMAGQVLFEQAKNNPNSFTVVSGHLVDLFDEYPATVGADMQIMRLPSESTLDGMSCFKWKEMFNPGEMDDNFCQKSDKLCQIGRSPFRGQAFVNLGSATWGQEPVVNSYNTSSRNRAHFKFVVENWPLDGPFSILGQTLNVSTNFLQACANISTRVESGLISGGRRFTFDGSAPDTSSLACTFDQDSVLNEMFESYLQSLVANFKGAIFEGSVYFTQYNEEDNHAVPLGRTGVYMIKKSQGNRTVNICRSVGIHIRNL
uniref:Uncharacterized protein n=1 Tax=Romanomermis culicivorax TaxID=13658 RepID=A0A915K2I6_ROMCU